MANNIETFVLVELNLCDATVEPAPNHGATLTVSGGPSIKRIVRTFESRSRADEDLALLQEAMPAARFEIQTIEHIDR